MNPELWERVKEIYAKASQVDAAERTALLDRECAGDSELRGVVTRMLETDEPSGFLEPPLNPSSGHWIGRSLAGFEIVRELGRGGTGTVFLAVDQSLRREVAIKLLSPLLMGHRESRERFSRETRILAKLKHEHIAEVYSVHSEGDAHFFVMEYVPGHPLARELEWRTGSGEDGKKHGIREMCVPLLPDPGSREYITTVTRLCVQVARALQFAHEAGIVHRDVTPNNLLLYGDCRISIVDFGLAKDLALEGITRSSSVVGTPHYMSPEQVVGNHALIGERSDVYSLGVVLYELLTLRRPFEGESYVELFAEISNTDPRAPRKLNELVPRDLDVICTRAMQKDPAGRYQTAKALAEDLERFLNHQAIHGRPQPLLRRALRVARKHPTLATLAGAAPLALLFAYLYAEYQRGRTEKAHLLGVVETVRPPDAVSDWSKLELTELIEIRQAVRSLRESLELLPPADAGLVRSLEARFDELRLLWTREGEDRIRRASVNQAVIGHESELIEAVMLLRDAALLFPEDNELRMLAAAAYPRVRVWAVSETGAALAGKVLVRKIDPSTGTLGELELLGDLPLEETSLKPGYYRIIVDFEGPGFREMTRHLTFGPRAYELEVARRADEERLPESMVLFEACTFTFRGGAESLCSYADVPQQLAAYWMDQREVSNGEYRAFLEATGHEPPRLWSGRTESESWDRLPVVGLDWYDAVAFAEWAGKRLPTHSEWERAARGLEGRRFPWGEEQAAGLAIGNTGGQKRPWRTLAEALSLYLEFARPVDSHPAARTPEGLFHMFGNVREMTESMAVERVRDQPTVLPWKRDVLGGSWEAGSFGTDLGSAHGWMGLGPTHASHRIGLRLAKSARP